MDFHYFQGRTAVSFKKKHYTWILKKISKFTLKRQFLHISVKTSLRLNNELCAKKNEFYLISCIYQKKVVTLRPKMKYYE